MKKFEKQLYWIGKAGTATMLISMFVLTTYSQKVPLPSADERKIDSLYVVGRSYFFNDLDSAYLFYEKSFELSKEINFHYGIARATQGFGEIKRIRGDLVGSVEDHLEALRIFKEIGDRDGECMGYAVMGFSYAEGMDGMTALRFLKEAKEIYVNELSEVDSLHLTIPSFLFSNLGFAYFLLNEMDSAQKYQDLAFYLINNPEEPTPVKNIVFRRLSNIEFEQGNYENSIKFLKKAIENNILVGNTNHWDNPYSFAGIARAYLEMQLLDSALHYSYRALSGSKEVDRYLGLLEASELLAEIFKIKGIIDSAYHYLEYSSALKDEIFGVDKLNKLALLLTEQLEQQQKRQQMESENRLMLEQARFRLWILVAVLSIMVLAILLYFFYQKRNAALKSKRSIEKAYDQLRLTQAQLIQSEKMASLGELTAGIAHEIQNPLNFVNNFSEVNSELINELEAEVKNGNVDEVLAIAKDIKDNEQKINHHGKRADAIVKGMLQHSRSSTGKKEPTDINALADEYLRLSYHGLRAKDKSFTADFKTDFDPNLPKIYVIPPDIGRVLLNLINNAFYAVTDKAKTIDPLTPDGGTKKDQIKYVPTVSVSTTSLNHPSGGRGVRVIVKDNGDGIPPHIVDKIFQPFFTTKPTGQGTGLGLSLSYDIVKAHGGELKVETKEGEGTEFIIQLPII